MKYALVTFGCTNERKLYDSLDAAQKAADRSVGRLNCSNAYVYACDTVALAKTADISRLRKGEKIVYVR